MDEPAKYVIRAHITASGVVERSDVVGAVFGQTEGLLGNELDLRALQDSERVGRIEVEIASERGTSEGEIAIATDMDRVETAVLAAALETIERVGPCRASIEVEAIEDVRAAKRRLIVDRARELLASGFEEVGVAGRDLVSTVRQQTKPAEIEAYAGFPAGPDLELSDEIIVVEGRADVLQLLRFGITNAIGVEGTDVAEEIAELTRERSVTVFFDGDRGGNLLLLELAQIGDVDFVTFAPPGRSVEDLSLDEINAALAEKVRYEDESKPPGDVPSPVATVDTDVDGDGAGENGTNEDDDPLATPEPTLVEQVRSVIEGESGSVRLLSPAHETLAEGVTGNLVELLEANTGEIESAVIDATVTQRMADAAARTGVSLLIGRSEGEFTKRPTAVRVIAADRLLDRPAPTESTSSI